ncbi:hypothetical protein F5Y18DRAFT_389847 [Xylariaceae sp. FL1019]|nr:hypothetical protein F5Y18DRAFT_389847 [Xylariaceae sp. FL1019]
MNGSENGWLDVPSVEQPSNMTDLVKRARGDENNPITVNFDVSEWQGIAEQDCYVILCDYGGNLVWQRALNPAEPRRHRTEIGESLRPFQPGQLDTRRTTQITPDTDTAEEFPWASLARGGTGGHVLPAPMGEQRGQRTGISAAYRRERVDWGGWMTLNFVNYNTGGVFCPALFDHSPPDTSVCGAKKKTYIFDRSVDLADYDYVKVANSRPITFALAGSK